MRQDKVCTALARAEPTTLLLALNIPHVGQERETLANRAVLYANARAQKPERWSDKTRNWQPAGPVWLNPVRQASAPEIRHAA